MNVGYVGSLVTLYLTELDATIIHKLGEKFSVQSEAENKLIFLPDERYGNPVRKQTQSKAHPFIFSQTRKNLTSKQFNHIECQYSDRGGQLEIIIPDAAGIRYAPRNRGKVTTLPVSEQEPIIIPTVEEFMNAVDTVNDFMKHNQARATLSLQNEHLQYLITNK